MSQVPYFVPSIVSTLAWSMALIVALAIGVQIVDRWRRIRAGFGAVHLKPRYARTYLARRLAASAAR